MERIAHLAGQDTAALQEFNPAYVADGQLLPLGADAQRVRYAPISGPDLKPIGTAE
jgi:hypothetical protein